MFFSVYAKLNQVRRDLRGLAVHKVNLEELLNCVNRDTEK